MTIRDVERTLVEGGYHPTLVSSYGESWERDKDHKALISGWLLMVCSFGTWRTFSFGDAVYLGMAQMERIVRMRSDAVGVEDLTQYELWLKCDQYKMKCYRDVRQGL